MRIAILSDSPFIPTGYRNQAVQLASHLRKQGHEIHYLANAYNGITLDYAKLNDGTIFDFKIYGEMGQSYFSQSMSRILKDNMIDRFIILLDTFMLFQSGFMNVDTAPAKTFFWFPSDGGGGMPKNCEQVLRKINCPIAMAKWGQKQVKDYYGLDVKYIPHGVEPNRFYRLPDDKRTELRKKWGLTDKFVIGVVARNQPRKNLDRTIKTMALLKDRIPNAVLFLHMDQNDSANPNFKLPELVKKYNLENRVFFTGMTAHQGFGWDEMNEVYNVMDCFFLSTSGEGFGIPIIEAMSCEIPVVATNYTSTQELVIDNQAGLGIDLSGVETIDYQKGMKEYDLNAMNGTITGGWEVERGFCSITHAADQIQNIFSNPELARQMGINGRKAVIDKYDFKIVANQWDEVLK